MNHRITAELIHQHQNRFWPFVDKQPSGCWLWRGAERSNGYGRMRFFFGKHRPGVPAHRFAYILLKGPIPDGLHIDHLCRTPLCVNPDHMEPVTIRENTLRGNGPSARSARATRCIRGHEFSESNTIRRENKKGKFRECRICCRIRARQSKARRSTKRSAPWPVEVW